jgi:hypothetical protein
MRIFNSLAVATVVVFLPSSTHPICLMSADSGQSAFPWLDPEREAVCA